MDYCEASLYYFIVCKSVTDTAPGVEVRAGGEEEGALFSWGLWVTLTKGGQCNSPDDSFGFGKRSEALSPATR